MRGILLASLVALSAFGEANAGEGRLPWSVDVDVGWGAGAGSRALLDDVELALLAELNARGCFREFRAVRPGGEEPEAGVVLEMTLSDLDEEIRYEQSMAERTHPVDAVEAALGHIAMVEATVRIRLRATPGKGTLREETFREAASRRPLAPGDDAHAGARADFVREVARRTRALLCKGSRSRLEERIRAALAATP